MVLIPPEVQSLIIRDLDPQGRSRYSLMNKESYHTVNNFNQRAFRIEQVLAPFFDQKEIDELRLLQYRTGILISGSTALQFFDLVVYPDSDLDLYVELRHCRPLAEFLADVGYQFQPTPRQRSTFDEALAFTLSLNFAGTQNLHDEEEDFQGYVNNGIASVYNFSRGSKRIQVITSHTCSMDVILSFHSTCVMNIITYSHAYALYPRATFLDRVSMTNALFSTQDHRHGLARAKYAGRGWTMIERPSIAMSLRQRSEFWFGGRSVGDAACWTIPLSPIKNISVRNIDFACINSWSHDFDVYKSRLVRCPRTHIKLKYGYSLSQSTKTLEELFKSLDYMHSSLFRRVHEASIDEDSDSIDRQWAALVHLFVDENLKAPEENPRIEQIRAQLVDVYTNQIPTFEHRKGLITPHAMTVSTLLGELIELDEFFLQLFHDNPTYEFTFKLSDYTNYIWTNVKVILPLEHERTQGDEAVTIDGYPGNPTNCLRVAVPPLVSEN
ncbi:MAG: hypothetical protein NXY57DRAFT_1030718 [Lentinula lateritia]|nr:MAG: hypothetical protein NXY57DRAFT_1030718 [Lentinula lateritia]